MINGKTYTCGLIGNPVEHTMSPVIHNTLAEKMNLNMVYVPFLVQHDLAAGVKGAYALNIQGLNVTVPYKSEVIDSLAECDELAEKIGVTRQTIGLIEAGNYNPSISLCIDICKALNRTLDELFWPVE